jgi:hypothetical protein
MRRLRQGGEHRGAGWHKCAAGGENHECVETWTDKVAVESHSGGSQGEAGADSDWVAGVGDNAICGGSAAVDSGGAVEGVAGVGPWVGEHLSLTTWQNHLRLPNHLAKPLASAVKGSGSEEPL